MSPAEVVVVGAGLSGLLAAQVLNRSGVAVRILDKASRPGGRLATRRLSGFAFDTAVRSFEVRDPEVLRALADFGGPQLSVTETADGWVVGWAGQANELASALAKDLTVDHAFVTTIEPTPQGMYLRAWASGETFSARQVLLTMPVPQTRLLLQRSEIPEPAGIDAVEYERRLVLIAVLDSAPGTDHVESDLFDDVELTEGLDGRWLLRAQVSAEESLQRWDADMTHTLAELLLAVSRLLGSPGIVVGDCKRWRYATPEKVFAEATYVEAADLPVLLGGDGFGHSPSASAERACRSGLDMAARVLLT